MMDVLDGGLELRPWPRYLRAGRLQPLLGPLDSFQAVGALHRGHFGVGLRIAHAGSR